MVLRYHISISQESESTRVGPCVCVISPPPETSVSFGHVVNIL